MTVQVQTNILGPAEGDPQRHIGCLFDWKAVGKQTNGAVSFVEIDCWRGAEPPIHYHTREDEFFYVLDGEITFKIGDELKRIGPSGFVWAPRNVPHGFALESDRVRLLAGFVPAGNEAVFYAFSTPDPTRAPAAEPDPSQLPDLAALERLDKEYGVIYVGPPLRELLQR